MLRMATTKKCYPLTPWQKKCYPLAVPDESQDADVCAPKDEDQEAVLAESLNADVCDPRDEDQEAVPAESLDAVPTEAYQMCLSEALRPPPGCYKTVRCVNEIYIKITHWSSTP